MLLLRKTRERQKGFTLIELMTCIFIIAMLASILIPNLRRSIVRARMTGCQQNLKNLATGLHSYSIDDPNRNYPSSLDKLVPNYIRTVPTCPGADLDTYTTGYEVADDHKNFTISCKGTNHSGVGLAEDEPYYGMSVGLKP